MRRFLWIVILSLSAATLPGAAGAGRLTIEDVRAMAFDKGIATIKEIELDDVVWEVEGRDASGHKRDEGGRAKRRDRQDEAEGLTAVARLARAVYPHAVTA
jgi:hypothetical protein